MQVANASAGQLLERADVGGDRRDRTCSVCWETGMLVHVWAECLPSLFAIGDPRGAAGFGSGGGCGVFSLSGRGLDCLPPPRARCRMGERGPRSACVSQLTIGMRIRQADTLSAYYVKLYSGRKGTRLVELGARWQLVCCTGSYSIYTVLVYSGSPTIRGRGYRSFNAGM